MIGDSRRSATISIYHRLVQRLLEGGIPRGGEFDACRAVLSRETVDDFTLQALCTLLEGALADPRLDINDTQTIVPLLKELARRTVTPEEVV
jgi:hypothetical protein